MNDNAEPPHQIARDPLALRSSDLDLSGRRIRVAATLERPRLALLDDVLSAQECVVMMREAEALMTRSEVIRSDNIGTTNHETRTSSGMYFQPGTSRTADEIQRRLMVIMGVPITHGEPLQVLRYGPGDVYEPHFDFFEPAAADHASSTVALYGQRVATMICYLADVTDGGATVFPETGLGVQPRVGSALYFTYVDAEGTVDRSSLHGGAPVVSGEKWIVTQWCRAKPYRRPS